MPPPSASRGDQWESRVWKVVLCILVRTIPDLSPTHSSLGKSGDARTLNERLNKSQTFV